MKEARQSRCLWRLAGETSCRVRVRCVSPSMDLIFFPTMICPLRSACPRTRPAFDSWMIPGVNGTLSTPGISGRGRQGGSRDMLFVVDGICPKKDEAWACYFHLTRPYKRPLPRYIDRLAVWTASPPAVVVTTGKGYAKVNQTLLKAPPLLGCHWHPLEALS